MQLDVLQNVRQLLQATPPNTAAYSVFSKSAKRKVVLTCLNVVNTSSSTILWSLYLDRDGTTYTANTAIIYSQSLTANTSVQITWGDTGLPLDFQQAGNLAIQANTANVVTFTGMGLEL